MIERLQRGSQRAVAAMSGSQIAGTATLDKADATEITAEAARDTAKTRETLAEIGRSIQEKVNRFKV
ncbi:hypothetical protein OLMES_2912 [Oleiphilus messinensis]|uniref:Uncharacterized protein n=1 Tax=Oleiphilus messinensis TaxID=141451 RepID=A0A1Y0I8W0_9GAMM|nr:hypothetical protein [Oleiphilus messinensis]ARU56957.1 hypothetical protein OLMES_2912 [Oleiphilus messinensis]